MEKFFGRLKNLSQREKGLLYILLAFILPIGIRYLMLLLIAVLNLPDLVGPMWSGIHFFIIQPAFFILIGYLFIKGIILVFSKNNPSAIKAKETSYRGAWAWIISGIGVILIPVLIVLVGGLFYAPGEERIGLGMVSFLVGMISIPVCLMLILVGIIKLVYRYFQNKKQLRDAQ